KKKLNVIGYIVVASIFIFLIIRSYIEIKQLEKNHRFTIGRIIKIEPVSGAGINALFIYYVKGKKYSGSYSVPDRIRKRVGRRFYVMFNPDNPDSCKLLFNKPVPQRIKEAPPEGWVEIPKYKKKRKIRY
ncbi:MAG: hypothetical protein N4A49_08315, partial [Marinifilaceae bacterium]|nr:hypothetical protein [Marinifilaceae bacterium]